MAQEIDQMCFDNLDEFVNDENKLVTYKWLSRTLSMHTNLAKLALYSFVQKQRNDKDNDSLYVTYFLSGLVNEHNTMVYKVQVVPEDRLEASKSTYNVLTSCHIYSVQKGKLKDINSLYIADYDLLKENILNTNEFSAVTCPAAKLRSEDEIQEITLTKPPQHKDVEPVTKPATQQKSSKDKKAAGIAGMFAKAASKAQGITTEIKSDSSKTKEKEPASKGKAKAKQGGVMNFFAKQAAEPKQEPKRRESQEEEEIAQKPDIPQKTEPSPPKEEVMPKGNSKADNKTTKKGRKKKPDSDEERPTREKKRRRIKQQIIDSSSSEEEMEIESPIPSPPPPESDPEEIPPTPSPKQQKRRKRSPSPAKSSPPASPRRQTPANDNEMCGRVRKRKLVSKTSVGEDGFLVTEKVYENEWEDVPEPAKPAPEPTKTDKKSTAKPKKSPPAKMTSPSKQSGKQTSLMSFFKKK